MILAYLFEAWEAKVSLEENEWLIDRFHDLIYINPRGIVSSNFPNEEKLVKVISDLTRTMENG